MCCNTFPFDICNMIVLSEGQDGESSLEGQLSPSRINIIHSACPSRWMLGVQPESGAASGSEAGRRSKKQGAENGFPMSLVTA